MLDLIIIAANGFWGGRFKRYFFNVIEFSTLVHRPFKSAYRRHEKEKGVSMNNMCVRLSMAILVFTTTGEWVMLQAKFTRDLSLLGDGWIRCKFNKLCFG